MSRNKIDRDAFNRREGWVGYRSERPLVSLRKGCLLRLNSTSKSSDFKMCHPRRYRRRVKGKVFSEPIQPIGDLTADTFTESRDAVVYQSTGLINRFWNRSKHISKHPFEEPLRNLSLMRQSVLIAERLLLLLVMVVGEGKEKITRLRLTCQARELALLSLAD